MNNIDTVKKIEIEKKNYRERMALRDSVLKLQKNRDFQKVIEQGFMLEDCARYARNSGLVTLSKEEREDSLLKAQAAGHLKEFLHAKIMMGNNAEKNLIKLIEEEDQILYDNEEN